MIRHAAAATLTPDTTLPFEARGRFLCECCVSFHAQQGMCPRCPDEPLVDTEDEQAMRLIQERDQRRHFKRLAKYTIFSIAVMLPINLLCVGLSFGLFWSIVELVPPRSGGHLLVLWLFLHVSAFGLSVVWLEEKIDARFPTQRIAPLVNAKYAELKPPAPPASERFATLLSFIQQWRRSE